jgi:hypothetical protein
MLDLKTEVQNYLISTVELPPYSGNGYETMIFIDDNNDSLSNYQVTYHTEEDAIAGHDDVVAMVEFQIEMRGQQE